MCLTAPSTQQLLLYYYGCMQVPGPVTDSQSMWIASSHASSSELPSACVIGRKLFKYWTQAGMLMVKLWVLRESL